MLAKTGRPPLENPRNYRVSVRMSADEKIMLEAVCEMSGKGKNDVIREAVKRYYEYLNRITKK